MSTANAALQMPLASTSDTLERSTDALASVAASVKTVLGRSEEKSGGGLRAQLRRRAARGESGVLNAGCEPPEGEEFAALIRRARTRDAQALDALATMLRPHGYRLAVQLLGRREDAMDCVQESLLRFFTHIDRYDERQSPLPWFRRIVRNRAIDVLRRRKVRRTRSLDSSGPEGEPLEFADLKSIPADQVVARSAERQLVWRCLQTLSAAHREILVLRDYQDLAYREIADVLGVPTGTVMSRLHRARKELAREVQREREARSAAEQPAEASSA